MDGQPKQHRYILEQIAERAMVERELLPHFSNEALAELDRIQTTRDGASVRDLRNMLWASIDNDDSLDLDQLTAAEGGPGGTVRILVAIADVDSLVTVGSAIDDHARHNTTSVYTAAKIFPMLPEKLSTDLTSLNFGEDRLAIVVDMMIGPDGALQSSDVYRATVHNTAKLAYPSISDWLNGDDAAPEAVSAVAGLAESLVLQDQISNLMRGFRHARGALSLETVETKPIFADGEITDLAEEKKDRAKDMVEDFMIAANGVIARFLTSNKVPSIRRVVRTPKRWERITAIAAEHGTTLPGTPDARALEAFLVKQKAADSLHFPELSLSVIKLLGAGEYVAEVPGDMDPDHFGLAVKDYTHATAPNRRFTDLITQRLVKAVLEGRPQPYSKADLDVLAEHCTRKEDAAKKVERQVDKSAAALLLESRIGDSFEALVTGAAPKGTWVRLLTIPVEGRVVQGYEGLDVGDRVRVQLLSVDVERGFIDFQCLTKQHSPV